MASHPHGAITHTTGRKTDCLYRLSLKGLIRDEQGRVLVVKEEGRDVWDLPGGGLDHDESLTEGMARELHEEVCLRGAFDYRVIAVDEPMYLAPHNLWQVRMVFAITPSCWEFCAGDEADEIMWAHPADFADSPRETERKIAHYATLLD